MKSFFKNKKYAIISLASVLFLLGLWESIACFVDVDFLLPRFSKVVKTLFLLLGKKNFYKTVGKTLLRCVVGFGLSFVAGVILGIIAGIFPTFKAALKPVCSFIRAVPTMAITLIIMVWFKSRFVPVVIGFMMVFPIFYTSVSDGINTTDKKLLEMAYIYDFSFKRKLFNIYVPHVLPIIATSSVNAFGLNVKAVISAEILAYTVGSVGMEMYKAKANLLDDAAFLFAWLLVAVIISGAIESLLAAISFKISRSKRI